jgi:site-specific recombinase XerD
MTHSVGLPVLIGAAGEQARERFIEFFTASIRNRGTRAVYANAVQQFLHWCLLRKISLAEIKPVVVATYIEQLTFEFQAPTVKVHLAAIRRLFDFLVIGQIVTTNPASSVRGPRHVVKKGSTPVLLADDARQLLDSIDIRTIVGLRDRAIIGVMVYSFARVSATLRMNVGDYFIQGRRRWFRLHEKGSKLHDVPAHHNAIEYVEAYLDAADMRTEKKGPLFRTANRYRKLSLNRMHRNDVLRMIKRRARKADISSSIGCHTFRATGITAYLSNGGSVEHARRSPLTTPYAAQSSTTAHLTKSAWTKSNGFISKASVCFRGSSNWHRLSLHQKPFRQPRLLICL